MRFLTIIFMFVTVSCFADNRVTLPAKIVCSTWEDLKSVTQEVNEEPTVRFSAVRIINGVKRMVPGVVFLNKETTTFTIIERWDEDQYCVIGLGEAMLPYESY